MKHLLLGMLFSFFLGRTNNALAHCRTSACGALASDPCATDSSGCPTGGVPLGWPLDSSLTVVCTSGCDDLVMLALREAVSSWQRVRCDGVAPRIIVALSNEIPVAQERNLVFVEVVTEAWPYGATAVGRTILEFGASSGTLLRATISLNAEQFVLGFATAGDEVDAQAVLTHELGHALGLAHSSVREATMRAEAEVGYASELSTLHEDDEQGLCWLYSPELSNVAAGGEGGGPSPSGQGAAGCSVAHPGATMGAGWLATLLLLVGRRRRTVSRTPRLAR